MLVSLVSLAVVYCIFYAIYSVVDKFFKGKFDKQLGNYKYPVILIVSLAAPLTLVVLVVALVVYSVNSFKSRVSK